MKLTKQYFYLNLFHDWDGEIARLTTEDLWDFPNINSRYIRVLVAEECMHVVSTIKKLPWYKRLFNIF